MYEQFRVMFADKLCKDEIEKIDIILSHLDEVATQFEFKRKSEELIPFQNELPDAAKAFLVTKRMQGYSDGTVLGYKRLLELLFDTIRKDIDKITSSDIRVFLYKYQTERNISLQSLERYRTMIVTFFRWATEEGYLAFNCAAHIEHIKFEKKERMYLSAFELESFREACNSLREKAMFEFLFSTGCRVSEMVNLKKKDIDWYKKTVTLFGKGKKYRTSFLNARAELALAKYLDSRTDDSPYVFVGLYAPHDKITARAVQGIFKELSVRVFGENAKTISPHIIRHTTATVALQRGMPVTDIQKLLGHVNVNTTMIYAKTTLGEVQHNHLKYIN